MSTTDKFGSLLCTPATPVPTGFPWLDVTASPFFADPTGVRDSAGAIQAAINAAPNGTAVLIPPGTYLISTTILLTARQGLRIFGVSGEGDTQWTILRWNGAANGAVIFLDRCRDCVLQNFAIQRGLPFDLGIGVDNLTPISAGMSSTHNTFDTLSIAGAITAQIRIGDTSTSGNDLHIIRNCNLNGQNGNNYGVYIYDGQSKWIRIETCSIFNCKVGIGTRAGSFISLNTNYSNNTIDHGLGTATDVITIENAQSEGAAQFLTTGGPSGANWNIVIKGCRLATNGVTNPGIPYIVYLYNGTLTLIGNDFASGIYNPNVRFTIVNGNPAPSAIVVSMGNVYPNEPFSGVFNADEARHVIRSIQDVYYKTGGIAAAVVTGEWLNVRDFGAVGNGVADDSTAINRALATAGAGGQIGVFVPAGTYVIAEPIIVPLGVTFAGVGLGTKLQAVGVALAPIFPQLGPASAVVYVAQSDVTTIVRDMWIRGAYVAGTPGSTTSGIYVDTNAQSCQILNCKITDHSQVGVFMNGDGHLVDGCHFENNAIDGIQVIARDGRIVNNFSINDAGDPVNGIGWLQILGGCQRILVANNNVVSPKHAGISLSAAVGGTPTTTTSILDNTIYFAGLRGIEDLGSANVKIVANTIDTCGTQGIYLFNTEGLQVQENTIVTCGGAGIEADGTAHLGLIAYNLSAANNIGCAIRDQVGVGGTVVVSHNLLWSNTASDFSMNPGVAGRFVFVAFNTFGQNGNPLNITFLPAFFDNAAAIAGGLVQGDLYRNGQDPDHLMIVH